MLSTRTYTRLCTRRCSLQLKQGRHCASHNIMHPRDTIYQHRTYTSKSRPTSTRSYFRTAVLSGLAAVLIWYGYNVYKYYGYPLELMQLLHDSEQYIHAAEQANTQTEKITNLVYAEQKLRQALQYIDARLPVDDRSNISAVIKQQPVQRSNHKRTSTDFKHDIETAPVVNVNYVNPMLLPHTMLKLAQVLQSQHNTELFDQARALYIRSIQLYNRKFGSINAQTISPYRQLGSLYYEMQLYDDAKNTLLKTLNYINTVREHLSTENNTAKIDARQHASTTQSMRDYISLTRIIQSVTKQFDSTQTASRIDPSDAVKQLYSNEVESEICEQLGQVYRAQNHIENSINWSIKSYQLLQSYINPYLQPYYTNTASNTNVIDLTQLSNAVSRDSMHCNRRLLDLLNELTHDFHLLNADDWSLQAAISSISLLNALGYIHNRQQLPDRPDNEMLLPIITATDVMQNDSISTRSKSFNTNAIKQLAEQTANSITQAEQTGLNLQLELLAALCNTSTVLYSKQQIDCARYLYQLSQRITPTGYSNTRLTELQQLLNGEQLS